MPNNEEIKALWTQHRVGQDKYTYFLLAIVASGIAFAVQKTSDTIMTKELIILGIAILSWGGSFIAAARI